MRAIDADKLCEDLLKRWDTADKNKEKLIAALMAEIVTPIVVSQPTIESERKKGRWIVEPGIGCKCSNCDFDIGNDLDFMEYVGYCPSCGADMKGE